MIMLVQGTVGVVEVDAMLDAEESGIDYKESRGSDRGTSGVEL